MNFILKEKAQVKRFALNSSTYGLDTVKKASINWVLQGTRIRMEKANVYSDKCRLESYQSLINRNRLFTSCKQNL